MRSIGLAMICEDLSPEMGGQAVSIPLLGEHLEKIGVRVTYFSGVNCSAREKAGSSRTHVNFKYFGRRFKLTIGLFFQLWRYRKEIDILHLNNLWNFVPIIAYIFSRMTNKPYIVSTRGMAIKEEIEKSKLKNLLLTVIFRRILNQAHILHVTSDGEIKSLRALSVSSDILNVGHGVKKPARPPVFNVLNEIRRAKRNILFCGRVCRYKNIHQLLEAFSIFSERNPGWTLLIVGPLEDPVYVNELRVSLAQKGLASKVKFVGHKTPVELVQFYSEASIFANVSYSENFGLSIAEALSYGIPCLVPMNSPWTEVENCEVGVRVVPDVTDIANSLEVVSTSLLDSETTFQNAISLVAEYSWDVQAGKVLSAYKSILGRE